MTTFLAEYGMFLAKLLTLLGILLIIIVVLCRLCSKSRAEGQGQLKIRKLNDKYRNMNLMLQSAVLPRKAFKKELRRFKLERKRERKKTDPKERKRIFVLRFLGDIRARAAASLRESITAILTLAETGDEVVLVLESAGGTVHDYGFAASQLLRIRNQGIRLTAAIDKVAASGGYMMACVADRIVAAPFAIVGSIGVISQVPNFNRLLKKYDIDYEQITAGEFKRTLSVFGENTDKGRDKARQNIEETHELFKAFVANNRKVVDIEDIATGEHWYGTRALELKLVDQLCTSDDYLFQAAENSDLYEVDYVHRKTFGGQLWSGATAAIRRLFG
jgi:serine protease SohB